MPASKDDSPAVPGNGLATDADWDAVRFRALVTDWEAFLDGVKGRLHGVGRWVLPAAAVLAEDDDGLAAQVAAAPDAFLDLAEALPDCRTGLAQLGEVVDTAEVRLLAVLGRVVGD